MMNDFLLGRSGRYVVQLIHKNQILFYALFIVYGLVHLYSKFIYAKYIPSRINEIIDNNPHLSAAKIELKWIEIKRKLPNYILIPSRNELWFGRLNQSNGEYKLLFSNNKNAITSDLELISKLKER